MIELMRWGLYSAGFLTLLGVGLRLSRLRQEHRALKLRITTDPTDPGHPSHHTGIIDPDPTTEPCGSESLLLESPSEPPPATAEPAPAPQTPFGIDGETLNEIGSDLCVVIDAMGVIYGSDNGIENDLLAFIRDNLGETSERLPEIFTAVRNGDKTTQQLWNETKIAAPPAILDKAYVKYQLPSPEAITAIAELTARQIKVVLISDDAHIWAKQRLTDLEIAVKQPLIWFDSASANHPVDSLIFFETLDAVIGSHYKDRIFISDRPLRLALAKEANFTPVRYNQDGT